LTALQTFGSVHRNSANSILSDVLLTLENEITTVALNYKRIENVGEFLAGREGNIHYRTDDLGNFTCVLRHRNRLKFGRESNAQKSKEKTFY
jgi:hypothetical protein